MSFPYNDLSRLKQVPLSEIWAHEEHHFTPWLAQEENLRLLSDSIGLELTFEAREKGVGPYWADLYCRDANQNWVVIENQIRRTDHTHLGQLFTYAAGLQASTMIWIAERFTDEHKAALEWLNQITDPSMSFFGIEIQVWQIGESARAPKFDVVVRPNSWVKRGEELKHRVEKKEGFAPYWDAFNRFIEDRGARLASRRPSVDSWVAWSLGKSGVALAAVVSPKNKHVIARISFEGPNAKQLFSAAQLSQNIVDRLVPGLDWRERLDSVQSYIDLTLSNADPRDPSDWERQHEFLMQKLLELKKMYETHMHASVAQI